MELKEILGEELYEQVAEKLKGKGPQGRDVELVATNTGDYVPASKYETLKSNYEKQTVDYATLNSNYEKLNASKEKDIKNILVENYLEKANLITVNGGYGYAMSMIDVDKLGIENNHLVDNDKILENFISTNPALVKKEEKPAEPAKPTTTIPAGNGVNPPNPQGNVKDKAYYESAYKAATDIVERMALKREAGEAGINI